MYVSLSLSQDSSFLTSILLLNFQSVTLRSRCSGVAVWRRRRRRRRGTEGTGLKQKKVYQVRGRAWACAAL